MNITKKQLKKMILEEFSTVTTETYDEPGRLLDPNEKLHMSHDLEGFNEEVLLRAEEILRETIPDLDTDETFSLQLSLMKPGTELVEVVANAIAEIYKSGGKGRLKDPLGYR